MTHHHRRRWLRPPVLRSRNNSRIGRAALSVVVVGSLSVGLLVPAGPAQAAEANTYQPTATLEPQLQGYVDRATPDETYPNPSGDLPVGARVDPSGKHVTRSYFTFDVAGLRGKQIVTATLAAKETHANDCAHRAVEVWVTDPYTEDSRWDYQPAQKFRVASAGVPESGCAVTDARFDVAKALTWAAKNDQETLTLALRVAGNKETDERYGRRYEAAPPWPSTTTPRRRGQPGWSSPAVPAPPRHQGSGCRRPAPTSTRPCRTTPTARKRTSSDDWLSGRWTTRASVRSGSAGPTRTGPTSASTPTTWTCASSTAGRTPGNSRPTTATHSRHGRGRATSPSTQHRRAHLR